MTSMMPIAITVAGSPPTRKIDRPAAPTPELSEDFGVALEEAQKREVTPRKQPGKASAKQIKSAKAPRPEDQNAEPSSNVVESQHHVENDAIEPTAELAAEVVDETKPSSASAVAEKGQTDDAPQLTIPAQAVASCELTPTAAAPQPAVDDLADEDGEETPVAGVVPNEQKVSTQAPASQQTAISDPTADETVAIADVEAHVASDDMGSAAKTSQPTAQQPTTPGVRPLGRRHDPSSNGSSDQQQQGESKQSPANFVNDAQQLAEAPTENLPAELPTPADKHASKVESPGPAVIEAGLKNTPQTGSLKLSSADSAPPAPPEVHFADTNHDRIVSGVRTQLLPQGGSMQIRLDPPELGALQVMVEMREGVMTATFQTSNDEATRLLSHSLNHLKSVLESQGVSVERLQVQQAPKNESSNAGEEQRHQQQNGSEDHASRQEQQRKELLRRMWRKIAGDADPLDLVA
jgi:flagellar hook-length control protein FliK